MKKTVLGMICLIFSFFLITSAAQAAVWYVDGTVGSSGDGTSWHTAFKTINEAVPWAVLSDEIWVKKGVYPLSSTLNLNMKMIKIYGGFAGGETDLSQRDLKDNTTVIDGQNLHRCFYVYYGAPRIDGFTITGGITGPYWMSNDNRGGAIYFDSCVDLVPVVINCVFKNNLGENAGGAIANYYSSPYIINCSFQGNRTYGWGGAIFTYSGMPFITNCSFTNNWAGEGLGGDWGHGGAVYSSPGVVTTITNSILWGNSSYFAEDEQVGGSINVYYSNIDQDGFAGSNGNIRQDPLLAGSGKLFLLPGSPCIDTGNNSPFPYLPLTDYFGNDRIIDGNGDSTATVDMGAHEYDPSQVLGAWFVDGSISASGDGTSWEQAFQTIQEAANAAANGNEIYVKTGTYGGAMISKAVSIAGGYDGLTVIDGHDAADYGLYINNASVTIRGFTITRARVAGIYGVNSPLSVTNCIFNANGNAGGIEAMGGLANAGSSVATIDHCTFTGNSAYWYGGGLSGNTATVTYSTFSNNHAESGGGAISAVSLTVNNCTFTNNSAKNWGGAIYDTGSLVLTNSTFSGNHTTDQNGGAIYNENASSMITNCTFTGNSAATVVGYGSGGAIYNLGTGTHTISSSKFLGNTAAYYGGGMYSNGTIAITNSIFAGNSSGTGGGFYGVDGSITTIANCTFYKNSATVSGGGISDQSGMIDCNKLRVTNTILWGDTAPQYKETGTALGGWGGYCLTNYHYSDIDQSGYPGVDGNIGQDPLFVNILGTDPNGWDLHLQSGSPAIDRGNNAAPGLPPVDMDGQPRIMDGSGDGGAIADMGVYEVVGGFDTVPPTGSIIINDGDVATTSLEVTLKFGGVADPSGISQMCISNTTSCTSWEAYAGTKNNWSLPSGEGTKTVYGWFRDTLGNTNITPLTGAIILDNTPPIDGTLTATPVPYFGTIQLNWSGFSDVSGIRQYRLVYKSGSVPTDCSDGYEYYTGPGTSYLFDSASLGETYSFRVCAYDMVWNRSSGATASAIPDYDTTEPTGSIVINGGASYTRDYLVTLAISASDPAGVTHMCISESPSCTSWEAYATSKEMYIFNEGINTVYIRFRDGMYNSNATPFSDSITLDMTPPNSVTGYNIKSSIYGSINVSWAPNTEPDMAGYKINYYGYYGNTPTTTVDVGMATHYIMTGLTPGEFYYIWVTAYDHVGNGSGWSTQWGASKNLAYFDPVGDGKTDIAIYRSADGTWWIIPSSGAPAYGVGWGGSGFTPVPGDYDGDGKTDLAIYDSSTGAWWIIPSSGMGPQGQVGAYGVGWGGSGFTPVPGDYDGDGKTDLAIYDSGTGAWWIIPSSGDAAYGVGWGGSGFTPVPGDYDGDGKTDIAIHEVSTGIWWIIPSSNGTPYGVGWGGPAFTLVPGDYDGDGKTDIAIYEISTGIWWIMPSSGGAAYGVGWGGPAFTPVPGDYDGDGKTDLTIYEAGTGAWWVIPSSGAAPYGVGWGGDATDIPVTLNSAIY